MNAVFMFPTFFSQLFDASIVMTTQFNLVKCDEPKLMYDAWHGALVETIQLTEIVCEERSNNVLIRRECQLCISFQAQRTQYRQPMKLKISGRAVSFYRPPEAPSYLYPIFCGFERLKMAGLTFELKTIWPLT